MTDIEQSSKRCKGSKRSSSEATKSGVDYIRDTAFDAAEAYEDSQRAIIEEMKAKNEIDRAEYYSNVVRAIAGWIFAKNIGECFISAEISAIRVLRTDVKKYNICIKTLFNANIRGNYEEDDFKYLIKVGLHKYTDVLFGRCERDDDTNMIVKWEDQDNIELYYHPGYDAPYFNGSD